MGLFGSLLRFRALKLFGFFEFVDNNSLARHFSGLLENALLVLWEGHGNTFTRIS